MSFSLTLVALLLLTFFGGAARASNQDLRIPDTDNTHKTTNRPTEALGHVVPIDWSRFTPYGKLQSRPDELTDCATIFLNTVSYNLRWATNAIDKLQGRAPFAGLEGLEKRGAHDFIRPICNVAFGLAVALQTGVYEEKIPGVSKGEARAQALRLIQGAARNHRNQGWGYPWQSSLWAAYLGHGAWMLWDDLDVETRGLVAELVEWEADRLANATVPYWNGRGGDTKAEENAWNSMVLSLAVAMTPKHPRVPAWKEKCSEFMISGYSTKDDLHNGRVLDGRAVQDWLRGFNANADGSVVNHGFVHPDYMLGVHSNLRAFVVQPLAGQAVPEAADFNADRVYRCLVTREWPSPPYTAPGGTIYRPGEPFMYFPERADWSRMNCITSYLVDVHASTLGLDEGLPHRATHWMRVRAAKIREMQERHPDHRIWADGEFETWPGREQTACGRLGAAFLTLWIYAQDDSVQKANWLSREAPGASPRSDQ